MAPGLPGHHRCLHPAVRAVGVAGLGDGGVNVIGALLTASFPCPLEGQREVGASMCLELPGPWALGRNQWELGGLEQHPEERAPRTHPGQRANSQPDPEGRGRAKTLSFQQPPGAANTGPEFAN